ncbi:MAG: RNA polymerase sigma factor [Bacteroidota bacterium]
MSASKGDRDALSKLVSLWYKRIYNFTFKYFSDHDLAMETCQRTFISVYKSIHKLESPERFKSWLYRIAINYCHEEERRSKKKLGIAFSRFSKDEEQEDKVGNQEATGTFYDPEKQYQRNELSELLLEALGEVNEEQRAVLIMKEYEGLKFREIADVLGISENTAKSRLYYGLNALKKILEKRNINKETIHYGF